MRSLFKQFILVGVVAFLTVSCAEYRTTSYADPELDLSALKNIHVKKNPNNDRDINILIADKLRSKGISVTTEPELPAVDTDATVTYIDQWILPPFEFWWVLWELTITVRDPESEFPLASSTSRVASYGERLPPKELVDKVVESIYKDVKK